MNEDKEMENSKEISLTPCLTNLFKPATKYLGEELKSVIQKGIEEARKAKKNQNIHEHIKKVQEKIDSQSGASDSSLQQLDIFDEWVENIAEIDSENEELSEMWQNLLLSKGSSTKILIKKLKELDSEDAIVLLKLSNKLKSGFSEEDRYRLKKLEELELVEKRETIIDLFPALLLLGLFIILYLIFSFSSYPLGELIFSASGESKFPLNIDFKNLVIFLGIPITLYFIISFQLIKKLHKKGIMAKATRKLSWIGLKIVNLKY